MTGHFDLHTVSSIREQKRSMWPLYQFNRPETVTQTHSGEYGWTHRCRTSWERGQYDGEATPASTSCFMSGEKYLSHRCPPLTSPPLHMKSMCPTITDTWEHVWNWSQSSETVWCYKCVCAGAQISPCLIASRVHSRRFARLRFQLWNRQRDGVTHRILMSKVTKRSLNICKPESLCSAEQMKRVQLWQWKLNLERNQPVSVMNNSVFNVAIKQISLKLTNFSLWCHC